MLLKFILNLKKIFCKTVGRCYRCGGRLSYSPQGRGFCNDSVCIDKTIDKLVKEQKK